MATPDIELGMPMDQLMVLAICGVVVLLGLFVLLAWVRSWGIRMKKEGGACGGLDLEHLRRQREAGEIRPEEYDAICGCLTADPPARLRLGKARLRRGEARPAGKTASGSPRDAKRSGGLAERPIINDTGDEPERSSTDG